MGTVTKNVVPFPSSDSNQILFINILSVSDAEKNNFSAPKIKKNPITSGNSERKNSF